MLTDAQAVELEGVMTRAAEHEATLLACAMHKAPIAQRVTAELVADDWSGDETRRLFEALCGLAARQTRITPLAVVDWLKRHGDDDLVGLARELALGQPLIAEAPHALAAIREASGRRAVLRAAREMVAGALDPTCADPLAVAYESLGVANGKRSESRLMHYADAYHETVAAMSTAADEARQGKSPVPLTGWYDVDQAIVMGPGKLIVVAGRPGMGKSAFCMNIAHHVAQTRPVLMVSLEMTRGEIVGRAIAADHRIPSRAQASGAVDEHKWERLWASSEEHRGLKLWLADPSAITMAGVEATARQAAALAGEPIGMVLVDYIGLVDGEGDGETAKIAAISKASKRLAMALRCPVVMLSQLNRQVESRENKRPQLSDLRQSGAIEQDADIVLLLYRDDYYNPQSAEKGVAEVAVAKNRGGAAGGVLRLHWRAPETRFYSIGYQAGSLNG